MDILRKIMLFISCASFAVCCLFLNTMGGIAIISVNEAYSDIGYALLISTGVLVLSLVAAFFRKGIANLISLLLNVIGSAFYIYAIASFNGIPHAAVPKESIEVLTSRIYPSIIVTIALTVVIFSDFFSYERSAERMAKKQKKHDEKNRKLTDDEKII